MITNPIKIEIVTSDISDIEGIVEAVRNIRKSNPGETLEVKVRVEKFGNVKNIVHPWLDGETNVDEFAEKLVIDFKNFLKNNAKHFSCDFSRHKN